MIDDNFGHSTLPQKINPSSSEVDGYAALVGPSVTKSFQRYDFCKIIENKYSSQK